MNAYDNQLRKTLFRDELIEKAEWELVPLGAEILNFSDGELRFNKSITRKYILKFRTTNPRYFHQQNSGGSNDDGTLNTRI